MTDNPKDIVGDTKPDLSLVPPTALVQLARVMGDGARKYGPYNWREHPVRARVYVAAAMRHMAAWLDGEENARDSGAPHLAHAAACLVILLDAQAVGRLKDDRPTPGATADMLEAATERRAPAPEVTPAAAQTPPAPAPHVFKVGDWVRLVKPLARAPGLSPLAVGTIGVVRPLHSGTRALRVRFGEGYDAEEWWIAPGDIEPLPARVCGRCGSDKVLHHYTDGAIRCSDGEPCSARYW